MANIEITAELLKAIKKRTGKTRREMGRILNISEKWYGLIESGEKKISLKIKERARTRFRKEIESTLENEKVNVYLADPTLLEEFLEYARKNKLQKKTKRKNSNNALLKIESLALGFHGSGSTEEIAQLRSQLLSDDLEKAKIYLAAFDTDFDPKTPPPEKQESINAVRWFLKTMNRVFSEEKDIQVSELDILKHRRNLLPDDRQRLIAVAMKVDESNSISEDQADSMVRAWKLLIGSD
ncbi:MAG: helix-turn-helix domain-containing protein [Proteobacteria bacterium]|nr:helix-turn-helix domain-containing protein [Pseudomonadota bacterium]